MFHERAFPLISAKLACHALCFVAGRAGGWHSIREMTSRPSEFRA
jgi:hypothetical protein